MRFDEDPAPTDLDIELWCYKHQDEIALKGGQVKGEACHLRNAIRILYSNTAVTKVVWHPWMDRHIDIWCDTLKEHLGFATIWGPAASSKSNTFGICTLVDWWSAPKQTYSVVCSTTQKELKKRIWASIVDHFRLYQDKFPGVLVASRLAIVNDDDVEQIAHDADSVKAGIYGIAVLQGSTDEAKSNIIGVHLPYVRMVVDEMQATRRAAVEARANLSKGCRDFRFFGLGNPMSRYDVLGEFSEPKKGWNSINVASGKWRTKYGACYHFDGFNSPGISDPDRYPFLINLAQINKDIDIYGENSADVWTFSRGFIAPEGITRTVLTESFIETYHMRDEPAWMETPIPVAMLDPAFTSDGDKCKLQFAEIGRFITGEMGIAFTDDVRIKMDVASGMPVIHDIARQTKEECEARGVTHDHLVVDDSGVQSAADAIEMEWGPPIRIQFGGKPSEDMTIDAISDTQCQDEYKDRVTEHWFTLRRFGQYGQIRGMNDETCKQMCIRERMPKVRPKKLMSKADTKEYRGLSPDDADASCMVVEVARHVLGVHPGSSDRIAAPGQTSPLTGLARKYDVDSQDDCYLSDPIEAVA